LVMRYFMIRNRLSPTLLKVPSFPGKLPIDIE
jgi:hypothetical protein